MDYNIDQPKDAEKKSDEKITDKKKTKIFFQFYEMYLANVVIVLLQAKNEVLQLYMDSKQSVLGWLT